jgi:hypothetical protein
VPLCPLRANANRRGTGGDERIGSKAGRVRSDAEALIDALGRGRGATNGIEKAARHFCCERQHCEYPDADRKGAC